MNSANENEPAKLQLDHHIHANTDTIYTNPINSYTDKTAYVKKHRRFLYFTGYLQKGMVISRTAREV